MKLNKTDRAAIGELVATSLELHLSTINSGDSLKSTDVEFEMSGLKVTVNIEKTPQREFQCRVMNGKIFKSMSVSIKDADGNWSEPERI